MKNYASTEGLILHSHAGRLDSNLLSLVNQHISKPWKCLISLFGEPYQGVHVKPERAYLALSCSLDQIHSQHDFAILTLDHRDGVPLTIYLVTSK